MATPELPENAYRARSERGELQLGTWITITAILRQSYAAAVAEIRNPKETS